VHEKIGEMRSLLNGDATKLETMRVADAALLAADDIRDDLVEVFGTLPPEVETFGIAVEVEAIRKAAAEPPEAVARNAKGAPLRKRGRLVVGMCGSASARKGVDIFVGVAAALPALDFLWVGPWSLDEAPENIAFRDFARAPPNFYICGAAENPYAYMAMMDVFFLSSREDPNPLVLAEALALNLPILAFSSTTAIADRLGRSAVLCHGEANVEDAVRILAACSPEAVRAPAFRAAGAAFLADYDLNEKMKKVRDLIARLRGEPEEADLFVAAEMHSASTRYLGEGVVELTFS
jgi:glycosyltransferase involved in cell wall biosynthesis